MTTHSRELLDRFDDMIRNRIELDGGQLHLHGRDDKEADLLYWVKNYVDHGRTNLRDLINRERIKIVFESYEGDTIIKVNLP